MISVYYLTSANTWNLSLPLTAQTKTREVLKASSTSSSYLIQPCLNVLKKEKFKPVCLPLSSSQVNKQDLQSNALLTNCTGKQDSQYFVFVWLSCSDKLGMQSIFSCSTSTPSLINLMKWEVLGQPGDNFLILKFHYEIERKSLIKTRLHKQYILVMTMLINV